MSTLRTDTSTPGPQDNPVAPDNEPAPGAEGGLVGLLRDNLFKDVKNSLITLFFLAIFAYVGYRTFGFVFLNEKPTPDGGTRNAWSVVQDQLHLYMVGNEFGSTDIGYDRLWAAIYVVALAVGVAVAKLPGVTVPPMKTRTMLGITVPPVLGVALLLSMTRTILPTLLTLGVPVALFIGHRLFPRLPESVVHRRGRVLAILALLAIGLETNFAPTNVDTFGGLLLTVNVAFISIALCFPLGVVLALTRRSSFGLLRPIAVVYIELIRGVPLITLLFMGEFALGFFFPPGTQAPPSVIRAIIMVTLFSAAYVAEIVRGGLQSVPSGQTEAGQAVGLRPATVTRKIVLPQALRNSIPPLVGQFISLLKDTTLLVIIGQFDLLGVSDPILASPNYQNQGYAPEVYAFVALIFWIMCFAMSRASQRLETKLGVGTR